MAKNRSVGIVLIILGVLVNNYAYLTDLVDNTHGGLIYMGWKGVVAALLGLLAIFIGVATLLSSAKKIDDSST